MRKPIVLVLCLFLLFLVVPSEAVVVLGGLERFFSVEPGKTYSGQLLLSNKKDRPVSVKIYQSDYRFNRLGENYFDDPGTLPRSNAKWITFAPDRLVVAANSIGRVEFVIKVPEAEKHGVFWSLVMVEPQLEDDPELVKPTASGVKVRTVSRFAVQILTTFGKPDLNSKDFKFLERRISIIQGKRFFEIEAENRGLFYMRPTLWAEIFDKKGKSLVRLNGGAPQILPECSVRYRIDINDIPPGDYEALVVADTGQSNVVGARYKLKIE